METRIYGTIRLIDVFKCSDTSLFRQCQDLITKIFVLVKSYGSEIDFNPKR